MSDPLLDALQRHFGFGAFRPGQEQVIRRVLTGGDALLVMPTGSGKSLCFQLPALMMEGCTLVVSPLIALMKDQVDALVARRIPATFLNSTLSIEETTRRLAGLRMGRYKLVYVAPERFRNPRFLEAFREAPLAMLAVDEAHCISTWGHDFRPDYLHLGEVVSALPPAVRLIAVTATATDAVRRDIASHLRLGQGGRPDPAIVVTGFERPNLALNVTRVRTHGEKLERCLQVIEFFRTGILYCATRKMVERVRGLLAENGVKALAYSGGMADDERSRVQDAFMRGEAPVVVATNAFGMGVDRQDIRFVIHWDVPGSLEAYYQEVGRAGRDGHYAWCELLFNYADVRTQEFFIASANPPPGHVYELYAAIRNACAQGEHGEASHAPEGWAELAGLSSATSVRNLFALFERHGLLSRRRQVGSPYSIISVPQEPDRAALERICAGLQRKEETDRDRLQEMLGYVDARVCRHRFLLAYFGEETSALPKRCAKCDHCHPLAAFPPRVPLSAAALIRLRKELSCIARMHGRGDYPLAATILRGTAPAPWTDLSTFGLLAEQSLEAILRDLEALEMDGYLAGMALTPAGYDLVFAKADPTPIATFRARPKKADAPSRFPDPAGEPPPPRQRTRPAEGGLATALRQWTREEADRRGLPAYMVLNNKTIAELARKRPTTPAELELIPGLGDRKLAKYGDALLDLIEAFE
ncbi:MAG: RecQ family ATP-dependent DNA helicase, partial [Candidatus Spyradenecus sp.]